VSEEISQDISIHGEGNIVVGKGDVIINPLPPAEARLRHDLGILMKNVETTWIKGVLEKSVHEAALLELGMEIREEAVDNPWRMVLESPDQSREVLSPGRKIKDIFNEANRLLLILGEPGSGKTTTLLQLARDLIAEVDQSFTQPVPVILNLSTWTNKQQLLDEWLIAELNSKYHLPKKDGKRWLKDRRILPMLDGLDEIKAENRAACVEKINQLVADYGLQGLVVCSRVGDYTNLDVRLKFYRAIYIQPLTTEQVDEYLNQAGEKLASLYITVQRDGALKSMAQSPLILNIMSLAYQNVSADALSDSTFDTDEARRKHLFDTYITRMFNRKAGGQKYNDEQTKQRLSWLARNMQRHNQELFLIENLQASWLLARGWQRLYVIASRLASGLCLELIWLGDGLSSRLPRYESVFQVVVSGFIIGLIAGLAVGIIDVLRSEWLRSRMGRMKSSTFWWSVTNVAFVFLIIKIILWMIRMMHIGFIPGFFEIPFALIFGIRGSRQNLENDIQTVEALYWSWRKALKGGISWGLIGGLSGVIFSMIDLRKYSRGLLDWLFNALVGVMFGGLIGGLSGASFSGLTREIVETKSNPNQGIKLSMRNSLFGGVFVGLIVIVGLACVQAVTIINVWFFGSIIGMIGALWYGGLDVIQHYTLRLILIIQSHTPANYARFLDYAVDRIFLQKVGGGYRFIHRLLLEHFAEMYEWEKKS